MNFTLRVVAAVVVLGIGFKFAPILAVLLGCGLAVWAAFVLALRKWERDGIRRQAIYSAANRAEIEDAQFRADDERGIYGQYPPERLTY
ncbi:hypothetical protein [Rhodococcus qingshengii]|uniref:hypothetical protein n=1 Tax=Rhodococcus qingshengii TaxID=334542 RepID=UPI001C8CB4B7|nr:hypothetical protein [Rhodococcus qingshengii]MBX9150114.1 hypothetical protein [Rhodococcus qingshengii]